MIKKWQLVRVLIVFTFVMATLGCSQSLQQYQQKTPKLNLKQYFNGTLIAHGLIQDRSGNVTRRFTVELSGEWQGNKGQLDEVFYFDDGEIDYRCWNLEKEDDNYVGTAGDVIGEAKGQVMGNALNWQYDLIVNTDYGEVTLYLDDWLYLIDESVLINKTDLKKFGLTVATLTLSINKLSTSPRTEKRACL